MNRDYQAIVKKHEVLQRMGETTKLTDRYIKYLIDRLYEERTAKNCYKKQLANIVGADPDKYFNNFDNEQQQFEQQIVDELEKLIPESKDKLLKINNCLNL